MGKRGSEQRQKMKSVLVRMTQADYERLSEIVERDGGSRADYLRSRIGETAAAPVNGSPLSFTADELKALSGCTRSMGHLAGMLKRSVFELPPHLRPSEIEELLNTHHNELKLIQRELLALIADHSA